MWFGKTVTVNKTITDLTMVFPVYSFCEKILIFIFQHFKKETGSKKMLAFFIVLHNTRVPNLQDMARIYNLSALP